MRSRRKVKIVQIRVIISEQKPVPAYQQVLFPPSDAFSVNLSLTVIQSNNSNKMQIQSQVKTKILQRKT